jgi:hypothetical protein
MNKMRDDDQQYPHLTFGHRFCLEIYMYYIRNLQNRTDIKPSQFINSWPLRLWSCGSWVSNYLCKQCLSTLMLWVQIPLMASSTRYNIMWYTNSLSVVFWVLQFPPPINLSLTQFINMRWISNTYWLSTKLIFMVY